MGSELASECISTKDVDEPSESITTKNMDEQGVSQEHLNPSTQGEHTASPKLHKTQKRARLETSKLLEELKGSFKQWEDEITEQRSLLVIQADKVTSLQEENQKLKERVNILQSQAGQVFKLQESLCESKTVIGELRQEVKSLQSFRDAIMDSVLGVQVGQLYRDKCRLQEDLCNIQNQFESAKRSWEVIRFELELYTGEECNSKLEQKVEMMERAGHVDSVDVDSDVDSDSFDVYFFRHVQHFDGHRPDINSVDEEGLQTPHLLESKANEMFDSIAKLSTFLSTYGNHISMNI